MNTRCRVCGEDGVDEDGCTVGCSCPPRCQECGYEAQDEGECSCQEVEHCVHQEEHCMFCVDVPALVCVRHPIMRDEACVTCNEAKDRNDRVCGEPTPCTPNSKED